MRTIGFETPGGPEVLWWYHVDEPSVGPGQVKIEVHAATVNPSDVVSRSGLLHDRYAGIAPPFVPGWDAAGVVVDVADDVHWRVGDEVVAVTVPVFGGGGTYAERIVVDSASVVAKPQRLSFAEAATFPMNGLTALRALDDAALAADAPLAVTGAAGAVGAFSIEIATRRGFTVIADAAEQDEVSVRGFGADIVVPRGAGFGAHVRELFPAGVDAVIDTALLRDSVLVAVRDRGVYVGLRTPAAGGGVNSERGIVAKYPVVAEEVSNQNRLREVMLLADSGALTARVAEILPADEVAQAHRIVERGGLRGRVVLQFSH